MPGPGLCDPFAARSWSGVRHRVEGLRYRASWVSRNAEGVWKQEVAREGGVCKRRAYISLPAATSAADSTHGIRDAAGTATISWNFERVCSLVRTVQRRVTIPSGVELYAYCWHRLGFADCPLVVDMITNSRWAKLTLHNRCDVMDCNRAVEEVTTISSVHGSAPEHRLCSRHHVVVYSLLRICRTRRLGFSRRATCEGKLSTAPFFVFVEPQVLLTACRTNWSLVSVW